MSRKSTSNKKVNSDNVFFLKVIKLDNEFAHLIDKAREDCGLPLSPNDPDEILKEKENRLFYWISVIRDVYNLPIQWSTSLWKYITEGLLTDPGIGISYNAWRAITSTENRFEPLQILIYEHVSIKEIKDWLEQNKDKINYHLWTLPHKRRSMNNSGHILEILKMKFKKKMKTKDIYEHYIKLTEKGEISQKLSETLSYNYITTIISRYKKLLKGEPFYKNITKNR